MWGFLILQNYSYFRSLFIIDPKSIKICRQPMVWFLLMHWPLTNWPGESLLHTAFVRFVGLQATRDLGLAKKEFAFSCPNMCIYIYIYIYIYMITYIHIYIYMYVLFLQEVIMYHSLVVWFCFFSWMDLFTGTYIRTYTYIQENIVLPTKYTQIWEVPVHVL